MRTTSKLCLFAFTIPLILFSCGAPQTEMEVTLDPAASLATPTSVPPTVTVIASPQAIPKQNDLIFVEFFAVT
jgi:hypothetical protein